MKKERPLLTLRYIGEMTFISVSQGYKTFTFKRENEVKECNHELLEMLMESYPGEIEVVGVESEDTEIIETNPDESQPEVRTIARRRRRS